MRQFDCETAVISSCLPVTAAYNSLAMSCFLSHFQKFGLEYEHYLKQVVSVLEGDEDFKKKLDEANSSDIKVVIIETDRQQHCSSLL